MVSSVSISETSSSSSSSATFECHLCNLKPASLNILTMFSLNVFAESTLSPSQSRHQHIYFVSAPLRYDVDVVRYHAKWYFMVRSRTNDDSESPNIRLVNRNATVSSISQFSISEISRHPGHLHQSLSVGRIVFKPPVIAAGFKQHRVSTFQSVSCNAWPTSKHSLKDGLAFVGLTDASYTIRRLVVSIDFFITSFCGMYKSFDVVVAGASSTISSVSCSFILSSYSLKSPV